jgi:hypothetical protein
VTVSVDTRIIPGGQRAVARETPHG